MALPLHLILIRHGESEGNIALNAAKQGSLRHYTEEFMNRPGRQWPLSPTGVEQAQVAGQWLQQQLPELIKEHLSAARYYVSPLVRTKQTAGNLGLTLNDYSVEWRLNRSLRERDWGDIELLPKSTYREKYPDSAHKETLDPLYWRPPGGESIADVAENRVRNFLDTLHRECSEAVIVAVTHGEFIRATHLTLTRANDEEYSAWEKDDAMRIHNCEIFHYSRVNPYNRTVAERITYLRRYAPVETPTGWTMKEKTSWEKIGYNFPSNEELLNS
jgi:broad specificity phosphatase PhoE